MSGDKPHLNGTGNGLNGAEDHEMEEQSQNPKKGSKQSKDKDGDDEMTVVVPPSKGSTPTAPDKKTEADVMNGAMTEDSAKETEPPIDPQEKAIAGKVSRS